MIRLQSLRLCLLLLVIATLATALHGQSGTSPDWAKDVVWYQIFPERFNNGDPSNDPIRASLDNPRQVPPNGR
jgi:hypothetical protein